MRLLVVRHAIAEDREAFAETGRDDSRRPLTGGGVRKMRRAAHGLRQLVPSLDAVVSSPFLRARDTAEIVRREYDLAQVQLTRVLEPEKPLPEAVRWLERFTEGVVAIVGHEPQLGRLATFLTASVDRPAIALKKGGACLIEFDGSPTKGGGALKWLVSPAILRRLAG